MRPTFVHYPLRLMTGVHMHMWGKMMPRSGQPKYPVKISTGALALLASEADHMYVLVLCPYVGMEW